MSTCSRPRPRRLLATGLRLSSFALAALLAPAAAQAQSAIIYGSLGNFDISNDTGQVCHGFEVEADGITPTQVVGSFSSNRYGSPSVVATPTGTRVTWLSPRTSDGSWATRTLPHSVPWFPGQCYQWTPGTYENSGCEHFGTSTIANPVKVTSRWLCEDASDPSQLVKVDPPTAVPMPTYYVQPPAQAGNPPQLVMEVEAPEPAEAPSLYGDAQWMRIYERELPRALTLDELMADNPNVVPMDVAQLEADYDIIQDEPASGGSGNRRRKRHGSDIAPTTRAVVRRIEMWRYTGQYDAVTHEALCADLTCTAPADGEIGELLSVQMTAANVQPDALTVTTPANGRVESLDRVISCGSKCVAPYEAGTLVTLTVSPDSGYVFSGWTGGCSGTDATCTVTINGAVTVAARFTAQSTGGGGGGTGGGTTGTTLSVKVSGKGTVKSTPAGITCGKTCSASVPSGTALTLTATPANGFVFQGWLGACAAAGTNRTCALTMTTNSSVEAVFKK